MYLLVVPFRKRQAWTLSLKVSPRKGGGVRFCTPLEKWCYRCFCASQLIEFIEYYVSNTISGRFMHSVLRAHLVLRSGRLARREQFGHIALGLSPCLGGYASLLAPSTPRSLC